MNHWVDEDWGEPTLRPVRRRPRSGVATDYPGTMRPEPVPEPKLPIQKLSTEERRLIAREARAERRARQN